MHLSSSDSCLSFYSFKDPELSEKVNATRGLPLLYISHNAITLQGPSEATIQKAEQIESERLAMPSQKQLETLDALVKQEFGEQEVTQERKRKRKRQKGPNPLSCKKKKVKVDESAGKQSETGKKKRTRKRHKKKNVV